MKRILAILLSCVMLLAMMPMSSLMVEVSAATAPDEVYVGGVSLKNGYYVGVGSTTATTTKPGEKYAYYKDGVLTLYNYSYDGPGTEQPFYTVGDGLTYFAAITAEYDLTVRLLGTNTLAVDACSGDDELSVAICTEGNLTITGSGNLNVTYAQCGIVSAEENVTIKNNGVIDLNVVYAGIYSYEGSISVVNDTAVTENVTLNVLCGTVGLLTGYGGGISIDNSKVVVKSTGADAISGLKSVTITDSYVSAITLGSENYAILSDEEHVTITNSDVYAESEDNIAIWAELDLTVRDSDLTARGGYNALVGERNLNLINTELDARITPPDNQYLSWALRADNGSINVELGDYQVMRAASHGGATSLVDYVPEENDSYHCVTITTTYYVYVGGIQLKEGYFLSEGATEAQKVPPDDHYAKLGSDGVLTLKNYSYSGAGYYGAYGSFCGAIVAGEDLTIQLCGDNDIDMQNTDDSYAIYCAGQLTIKELEGENGSLRIQNTYEGIDAIGNVTLSSGDVEIVSDSYAIYSEGVVAVTGSNLRATSESDDGIYSDAGVTTNGGSMHVTADLTAINTVGSYWQFAGSDVTLEGFNGGISANGVLVSGGNLTATADMQAIYSHGAISMNNCNATFVSTNVSKDDTFAALYSRSDSITIGANVMATVSRFNDGSSPEPLDLTQFANYDYVSLSSPITKLDFYLEGYRAGNTLLDLKILGHENLDRSGYMEMYQKLTEGLYYTFELMLKIDDFQGDPAKDITLDGRRPKSVEVNSDGTGYNLYYDLPACPGTTVKGVRVLDLDLPRGGEHPDYTATLYNPYTYKFANYGIDGCGFYWLDSEGGVMMPEDTFVEGETYSLEMKFEPNMDNGVTAFDTSSDFYGIIDNDRDGMVSVGTMVSSKSAYIMDEFVCAAGDLVRLGDVNLDGEVDMFDVLRLFKHVSEEITLESAEEAVADVNDDDEIDMFDVLRLFKFVSEEITEL